jgi:hypothetical protein
VAAWQTLCLLAPYIPDNQLANVSRHDCWLILHASHSAAVRC